MAEIVYNLNLTMTNRSLCKYTKTFFFNEIEVPITQTELILERRLASAVIELIQHHCTVSVGLK